MQNTEMIQREREREKEIQREREVYVACKRDIKVGSLDELGGNP